MNQRYNVSHAHVHALREIKDDAAIGRLPFYDYAIEYYAYFDQGAPESSLELISFIESCEKIGDSECECSAITSIYNEHALEIPIGILDLPVWWARAFIASIREVNWVEPDPDRTQATFGWDMVHLQGSYLDIQYSKPITAHPEEWHLVGGQLIDLHRRFEPGPFTQRRRLIEFI